MNISIDEYNKLRNIKSKYQELIYAVGSKHPEETRHETALRYILDQENRVSDLSCEKDSI